MNQINKDYIEEYLYENLKEKSDFLTSLEKEALENHIPIISPEVGQFLRFLIKLNNPKRVLEVGTAIGFSGLVMLDASKDIKKLVTIEKREDLAEIALKNMEEANEKKRVELKVGDALEVLKSMDDTFDFVFIDAAKGHYGEYFEEIKKMITPKGVIVCDNVLYKGMVANDDLVLRRKKTIVKRLRNFIKEVTNLDDYESTLIPMGDGLLVIARLNWKK